MCFHVAQNIFEGRHVVGVEVVDVVGVERHTDALRLGICVLMFAFVCVCVCVRVYVCV